MPVLLVVLLHLEELGLEHVTVTLQLHNASLLIVSLLLEPVEVTEQVVHVALGVFLLLNRIVLLSCQASLVVFETIALLLDLRHLLVHLECLFGGQIKIVLSFLLSSVEVAMLLL